MQTVIYIGIHKKHIRAVFHLLKEDSFKVRCINILNELPDNNPFLKKAPLVLVDMAYVHHDAPGTVQKLRGLCGQTTRIVMMAEYSFMAMALSVHAGFDEFISRPVGKDEVLALLKGQLITTGKTRKNFLSK